MSRARRTRQANPAGPPANPTQCGCLAGRPTLIGTFRDQELVSLYRWHHPILCGQPPATVDIAQWRAGR